MPQPDAFRTMYERYAEMVYSIALTYLHNPADAEDITADVFIQIFEKDIKFQDENQTRAWLVAAVRNRCKNQLKSWHRQKRTDVDVELSKCHDSDKHILSEAMAALASLPEHYRLPLILTAVEGYSTAEAAKMLHCAESTILTRVSRARAIIRKKLWGAEND